MISLVPPLLVLLGSTWISLHKDINLGDEGYLVYGTQAVLRGEVPIRDFRAYDPARYYWCALWCRLIGSEFIAIRISMAVVSALSVALISAMVLVATGDPILGLVAGIVSQFWMHPRHKQIEHFFSLVCCAVMFALIGGAGDPFWLGTIGAVAAAFGLNILTYFIAAAFLSFAILWLHEGLAGLDALAGFSIGLLCGMAVLFLIAALTPGFLRRYVDFKVLALLRRGTTNLVLPRPWLWRGSPPQFSAFTPGLRITLQALFTLLPVMYLATLIWIDLTADSGARLAVAASACGLVYFHHALSRADLSHMQQVMQPFIVTIAAGSATLLPASLALTTLLLSGIFSAALLWDTQDFSRAWRIRQPKSAIFTNGADRFQIPEGMQKKLVLLRNVVHAHSSATDTIFVAPALPAVLALFHRKTAVYDTFPVYPAIDAAQQRMIRELEISTPPIAIISKANIDQREDLRFENNYPSVFQYIKERYQLVNETSAEYIFVRGTPPTQPTVA
tara:strand:+ start:183550 stop:185061 length:1512 start_codon:yes stop_codon:yes gene_type:complete